VKTYTTLSLCHRATLDTPQTLSGKWHLWYITIQNGTCLGMSGSLKNSHELVQSRINVPLVILDPLFSTRVREFYAGFAHQRCAVIRGRQELTALWKICCLAPFLEKTLFTTRPESFFSASAIAASTTSRDVGSVEVDALVDAMVDDS
jgi:hypothetical protein